MKYKKIQTLVLKITTDLTTLSLIPLVNQNDNRVFSMITKVFYNDGNCLID